LLQSEGAGDILVGIGDRSRFCAQVVRTNPSLTMIGDAGVSI
jgi:hypothetical protein